MPSVSLRSLALSRLLALLPFRASQAAAANNLVVALCGGVSPG